MDGHLCAGCAAIAFFQFQDEHRRIIDKLQPRQINRLLAHFHQFHWLDFLEIAELAAFKERR